MKKKIFSTLLMGAFFLASMSMFTSCKDYDDDINANKTAINDLKAQLATLQTALDNAKSAAATAQATADKAVADAAAAKTAADKAQTTADAAKALAEAAATKVELKALSDVVDQVKALAESKVSQAEYDAKVAEIAGKIDAINGDLNKLTDGLNKEIKDREDADQAAAEALAAVKADLQGQIDVLKAFKEEIEKQNLNERLTAIENLNIDARLKDLEAKMKTLLDETIPAIQKNIKDLQDNKADITYVNSEIAKLKKAMEDADAALKKAFEAKDKELEGKINTLNVFLKKTLTSLTFKPAFYYGGVEAAEAIRSLYIPIKYIDGFAYDAEKQNGYSISYEGGIFGYAQAVDIVEDILSMYFNGNGRLPLVVDGRRAPKKVESGDIFTGEFLEKVRSFDEILEVLGVTEINPLMKAQYHLNPSTVDLSNTEFSLISDDKEYIPYTSRAAQCDPQIKSWNAEDGILNVNIALDRSKLQPWSDSVIRSLAKLIVSFGADELIDYALANRIGGQVVYGYGVNSTFISQLAEKLLGAGTISVFALQANQKDVEGEAATVTSDYAAIAPTVRGGFLLADNDAVNAIPFSACLQHVGEENNMHIYPYSWMAIELPYTHELLWNDKDGIDLDEIVEVHAFSLYGGAGSLLDFFGVNEDGEPSAATAALNALTSLKSPKEITIEDLNEYGFQLKYDLIDYMIPVSDDPNYNGENETEQSSAHATLSGTHNNIITAKGINGDQNQSSIGREPLVRVELIDTNNDNAIVSVGFIKFQIIGEKSEVTLPIVEGDESYAICDGDFVAATWADMESKLLSELNLSKTDFENSYAFGFMNEMHSISVANWNTNVSFDQVYIKDANDKWVPATLALTTDRFRYGSFMLTNYDRFGKQTNTVNWILSGDQMLQLLVKRNAKGEYVDANGETVTNIYDADFNDEVTVTVACKFKALGAGLPDVYGTFTTTIKRLHVAKLLKLSNYWYADNTVTAGTGEAEIHINVDAFKETSNADITHFGDTLNETLKTRVRWYELAKNIELASQLSDEDLARIKQFNARIEFLECGLESEGEAIYDADAFAADNDHEGKYLCKIVSGASGQKYGVFAYTNYNTYESFLVAVKYDAKTKKFYANDGENIFENVAKIVNLDDTYGEANVEGAWGNDEYNRNPNFDVAEITMEHTSYGMDLLNRVDHKDLKNSLTGKVGVYLTEGACHMPVVLDNNTFNVKFLRPLSADDAKGAFTDAQAAIQTIKLFELYGDKKPGFKDWRDLWGAKDEDAAKWIEYYQVNYPGKNQYPYWNGYADALILWDQATTNLDGGTLGTTLLSEKDQSTTNPILKYNEATGELTYYNNNNNIGDFKVWIPVRFGYYWGQLYGYKIEITVDKTVANGAKKF
jgi:hypothetical protein